MNPIIFHLAFPSHDLSAAKRFYVDGLGCSPGRETAHALILELGGHQVVAQKIDEPLPEQKGIYPRHFGLIFASRAEWEALLARAREKGLEFYQEPKLRHPGTPTAHDTFFLKDPSNNLLEFKHYHRESAIFGERQESRTGDYA